MRNRVTSSSQGYRLGLPTLLYPDGPLMTSLRSLQTYHLHCLCKIKASFSELLDFQSRIRVVHIFRRLITDQSFVINEDGFKEPLEWMKKRAYQAAMLERVEKMKNLIWLRFSSKTNASLDASEVELLCGYSRKPFARKSSIKKRPAIVDLLLNSKTID